MNKLIIIRGIPGSGKTTLKELFNFYNTFEFDDYWLPYCGRNSNEMKKQMYLDVEESLKTKTTIVVNVFSTIEEMTPYLQMTNNVLVIRVIGHHNNLHGLSNSFVKEMETHFEDYCGEILINNDRGLIWHTNLLL